MIKRILLPLIFGLAGLGVLLSLGVWQVKRLTWKEGQLAEIETRMLAAPVPLGDLSPTMDMEYQAVTVTGQLSGDELHVLTSEQGSGPGFRVIAKLTRPGTTPVMVDLGYVPEAQKTTARVGQIAVVGNLHWPDETDSFTPEPDMGRAIWFARDVPSMATALNTDPILVTARQISPGVGTLPKPVDTSAIPNDHLEYAVTWFSLAAVWAAMTGFFLYRQRRS